jgi:endonuclease G
MFLKKTILLLSLCCLLMPLGKAQTPDTRLQQLEEELEKVRQEEEFVLGKIEKVKLEQLLSDLKAKGLPALEAGETLVEHSAMCLVYSEAHEQAKWVAHIIRPEIIEGQVSRTNDFRTDPKVATGTTVEEDYFLKYKQADGSYEYDGFGYDRGHLAPSADFRWSYQALSESYFYSNMSPQLPEFNRENWAELENLLRAYIYRNPKAQLYVVTGPLLEDDLPRMERSKNDLRIPRQFWKVALDLENKQAIGFLFPHQEIRYPLETFAFPVDHIEKVTGIDFFPELEDRLEEELESQVNKAVWVPELQFGDVEPIPATSLARNHFNTIQAQNYVGKNDVINVCGIAVGARRSRKGNILINLDKQYPNQIFTVFIRKEHIINFPYDPEVEVKGKQLCAKGKVVNIGSTPTIFIEDENALEIMEASKK